jgi:AcrR family transcriptional regulator
MFSNMADKKRTRDPAAKRAALHAAAFALLAEHPYPAVSVAMIAQRAGIAVGSVYRFYPTKMALLEALSDALEEAFVAAMGAAWQAGGPYAERLDRLAAALFDMFCQRRSQIGVMAMTAGHRAKGSRPMGDKVRSAIGAHYRDGVAHGGFARHDPTQFAAAAYGLVEGLMHHWFADPTPARQKELAAMLAQMLRRLVL